MIFGIKKNLSVRCELFEAKTTPLVLFEVGPRLVDFEILSMTRPSPIQEGPREQIEDPTSHRTGI